MQDHELAFGSIKFHIFGSDRSPRRGDLVQLGYFAK